MNWAIKWQKFGPINKKGKNDDEATMTALFESFNPFIIKNSTDSSNNDRDCYQELSVHFILAVRAFDLDNYLDD